MNKSKVAPQRTPKRTAAVPFVAPAPAPARNEDADAAEDNSDRTLAERAFRLVRDDILNGRLAPDARLRINLLQQRYGLGLSPLREALLRLSSEGLVVAQGQRGFAVAPVSLAELQDQTVARKCLDIAALTQSMAQGDADWEAQVMAANHLLARTPLPKDANDLAAARLWEERHRAFHRALIAGCGSHWLMRLHNQLVDQIERYRTMRILHHKEAAAQVRDVVAEHAAITDAVLKRDVALASELMDRHISATAEAMRQIFEPPRRKSRLP
jgi:GntR family transcriptional regulator, carbon starvation induced regulator